MGQIFTTCQKQSNHIYNDTEENVIAILTDHRNQISKVNLKSKADKCIPKVKGPVTLSVFKEDINNKEGSCRYTYDSNRSFIVRVDEKKNLEIVAKYGSEEVLCVARRLL